MTYNYQLIIEYDGTNFVGWQKQKNGLSIQAIVQNALKKYFNKNININGSGRTDSGVHALAQSANFIIDKKIENKDKFINSLNFFLKKYPISIISIKRRNSKFHARFSAKRRIYKYVILNRIGSVTIDKNKVWHIRKKLNLGMIIKGAKLLKGTKDFSTFRSSRCSATSPIKTLNKIFIKKTGNFIIIKFSSQSFLMQQIRSMVGCLKKLGDGTWNLSKFERVLKSKKRSMCAAVSPPDGLYLEKIFY